MSVPLVVLLRSFAARLGDAGPDVGFTICDWQLGAFVTVGRLVAARHTISRVSTDICNASYDVQVETASEKGYVVAASVGYLRRVDKHTSTI